MNLRKLLPLKHIMALITAILLMSISVLSVSAQTGISQVISTEIVELGDGYALKTTISKELGMLKGNITTFTKGSTLIKDGVSMCTIKITATFDVNKGSNVRCVTASYSQESHKSGWSVESMSTSYNTNYVSTASATANGTAKRKVLGVTVESHPIQAEIHCDKYGNIY